MGGLGYFEGEQKSWGGIGVMGEILTTGCLKKKYPLLTGNRNEAIRYHYSPSS